MKPQVGEFIAEFSKEIQEVVRQVMESSLLVNAKVGRNTIVGSDIYNTLQVRATHDGDLVYDIILNDYLTYIESGRRKNAKMPPIEPIIEWARKRGIPSDNGTIYAIRRAIARDGIKPRPFMAKVMEEVDELSGEWTNEISDNILKIIDDFFNN